MKAILIAPILAISLSSWATAQAPGDMLARMEVRSGRAQILHSDHPLQSVREGESISVQGKAHLEVPAGSEVRVTYPGSASLNVWGPASLDWQPTMGKDGIVSDSITWQMFRATWCDLEVRRGSHHLKLPGGWAAQLEGGSMRLRGTAAGPLEMRLNAGRPVRVSWNGDQSQARPPLTIYPGSNIRLEQPVNFKVDQSNTGNNWDKPTWPYRRNSDTPAEQTARAKRPEALQQAPAWPLPEVPRQENSSNTTSQSEDAKVTSRNSQGFDSVNPAGRAPKKSPMGRMDMGDTKAQVKIAPTINRVAVQPVSQGNESVMTQKQVGATKQTTGQNLVAFQSQQWRNVPKKKLENCRSIVVQKATGVEVRVFAGGNTKVLVDRWDGKSAWVFTRQKDFHMSPGAVAVFDSTGNLVSSNGTVENYPALKGRPAFENIR